MAGITAEALERLAVAQYLYKSIAAEVSTASKGGEGIRAEADQALAELWETTGTTKVDLKVAGVKVGTFSLKVDDVTEVADEDALKAFLTEKGYVSCEQQVELGMLTRNQMQRIIGLARIMNEASVRTVEKVDPKWSKQVEVAPGGVAVWKETGEPVPGVKVESVPTGTTLRVDEKKVAPIIGAARNTVARLVGAEL